MPEHKSRTASDIHYSSIWLEGPRPQWGSAVGLACLPACLCVDAFPTRGGLSEPPPDHDHTSFGVVFLPFFFFWKTRSFPLSLSFALSSRVRNGGCPTSHEHIHLILHHSCWVLDWTWVMPKKKRWETRPGSSPPPPPGAIFCPVLYV